METHLPIKFQEMMIAHFGQEEGQKIIRGLDSNQTRGAVRLNPRKPCQLPAWMHGAEHVEWSRNGYRLAVGIERPNFTLSPQLHGGAYYVQEAASMVVESIVGEYFSDGKAIKALDLCAAPGGKTTAALSQMPAGSLMVANEYVASRANILKENIEKWGFPNVIITQGSTNIFQELKGNFNLVLADVPCSGEGMMRKDEEARRQWTPQLVKQCASLQREIAANGVEALAEGGIMIYSTCTFNTTENEENIEYLQREHGMKLLQQRRFFPHTTDSEGLFVAVLRKEEESYSAKIKIKPGEIISSAIAPWVETNYGESQQKLVEAEGIISSLGSEYLPIAKWLAQHTRIISMGTEVGIRKVKKVIPAHGVATSLLLRRGYFPEIEVSEEKALEYLSHRTPNIDLPSEKGYVLITNHHLPLGFINNLGVRYNNMYPTKYRIRHLKI